MFVSRSSPSLCLHNSLSYTECKRHQSKSEKIFSAGRSTRPLELPNATPACIVVERRKSSADGIYSGEKTRRESRSGAPIHCGGSLACGPSFAASVFDRPEGNSSLRVDTATSRAEKNCEVALTTLGTLIELATLEVNEFLSRPSEHSQTYPPLPRSPACAVLVTVGTHGTYLFRQEPGNERAEGE